MQDKIIQITDTLYDGCGQTYGLSESGALYEYKFDTNPVQKNVEGRGLITRYEQSNHRWELILKSPVTYREEDVASTGNLLSNCCAWDFNPLGYEKSEGIWQESCLKCGKLCEPLLLSLNDIENIRRIAELNNGAKKEGFTVTHMPKDPSFLTRNSTGIVSGSTGTKELG